MSLLVAAQNIKSSRAANAHYYIAHQACSSTFLCTWLYSLLVSHKRIYNLLSSLSYTRGPSLNFTTANHLCARTTSDPDAPRSRKFVLEFYEIQHFHCDERAKVGEREAGWGVVQRCHWTSD